MKRLAIIGYPIGHTLSPAMYNAAFPEMGIDATFEVWATPPQNLPAAIERVRGQDVLGICVTVPHKQTVMGLIDAIDPTAAAVGAVNCIVKGDDGRLTGHNTDRYGFSRSLREAGCQPEGMKVVMLGAGGSAHAVAYALAEAGVRSLAIANRSRSRLEETLEHIEASAPRPILLEPLGWQDESVTAACASADLIVNCTSVGMDGSAGAGESPLRPGDLRENVWVYDLVYRPLETPLLRQAREAGARPVAGLEMLIYQAVECLRLWTGREAPVDIMRKAAYDGLQVKE
ncbi:MAG TPA: shikimate dehydrogenase [Dehalococcoidia bacterium]|nr:shikimate dehydrogenase [Dehalococcoidia bacterium]